MTMRSMSAPSRPSWKSERSTMRDRTWPSLRWQSTRTAVQSPVARRETGTQTRKARASRRRKALQGREWRRVTAWSTRTWRG